MQGKSWTRWSWELGWRGLGTVLAALLLWIGCQALQGCAWRIPGVNMGAQSTTPTPEEPQEMGPLTDLRAIGQQYRVAGALLMEAAARPTDERELRNALAKAEEAEMALARWIAAEPGREPGR